jgi:hypothetical protein
MEVWAGKYALGIHLNCTQKYWAGGIQSIGPGQLEMTEPAEADGDNGLIDR